MSRDRYFAYGSNLQPARMRRRVPSSRALGRAILEDYGLRLDKSGSDGSAKANLRREAGARVWGVVYEMERSEWAGLDACEGGYARVQVTVRLGAEAVCTWTYVSDVLTPDPTAFAWYKQLILDGARHHALPEDWIALLETLRAR